MSVYRIGMGGEGRAFELRAKIVEIFAETSRSVRVGDGLNTLSSKNIYRASISLWLPSFPI